MLRRPALVPSRRSDHEAPDLAFEAVHEFVAAGQRVDPASLAAVGHEFRAPRWNPPCARHLLGKVGLDVA